jgi:drug/metabolite transporter (DMT)-like permease
VHLYGSRAIRDDGRMDARRERWAIIFAFAIVSFVWGSTYLAIRIGLETLPPLMMAGSRQFLAGVALYAIGRLRGWAAPTTKQWAGSALIGVLLLFAGNGGVVLAEREVSSSVAAIACGAVPVWASVFGWVLGSSARPVRLEAIGLGLGMLGVVLLNVGGELHGSTTGGVLLLVASLCWALGSVLGKKVPQPAGLLAPAAQMVAGGLALLAASGARHEALPAEVSGRSLAALAYLTVFGSIVAFSAYAFLLARTRPVVATSYAYVNPLVAMLLGATAGGEAIAADTLVAALTIVGAVALISVGRSKAGPTVHTFRATLGPLRRYLIRP